MSLEAYNMMVLSSRMQINQYATVELPKKDHPLKPHECAYSIIQKSATNFQVHYFRTEKEFNNYIKKDLKGYKVYPNPISYS